MIHVVFLGVIPLCYVSVSVAGVMLFGANTPEDILVEFQGNYVMEAAKISSEKSRERPQIGAKKSALSWRAAS